MAHIIRGNYCENGYLGDRGTVRVTNENGRLYDPSYGEEIYVRQYGSDAPIVTNGVWEFWPDKNELERLGLTPTQMVAP